MRRPCGCEWTAYTEFHREFVAFEKRGVAGVVWLLDTLAARTEQGADERCPLPWTELVRCVAEHHWRDPLSVARLAVEVQLLFRYRHELSVVEEAQGVIPSWAVEP